MKTTGSNKPRRPRRAFTPEFKAQIVEHCQRGDRSIAQVVKDFDLTETAVREWVRQAERDDGGLSSDEKAELAAFRRLCEDLEILKQATTFFAKGDLVNVHPFIEAEKVGSGNVQRACELLQVSRAACYTRRAASPSARERANAALTAKIIEVHDESNGVYGIPRIHAELTDQGALKRWRTTTIPDPVTTAPANLIKRDFSCDSRDVNSRWCGNITYISTWEG